MNTYQLIGFCEHGYRLFMTKGEIARLPIPYAFSNHEVGNKTYVW